jgi:hypothetical protein
MAALPLILLFVGKMMRRTRPPRKQAHAGVAAAHAGKNDPAAGLVFRYWRALMLSEQPFRNLLRFLRNVPRDTMFNPRPIEERKKMKKLGYIIAALGALAVAAPSIASAETVVIKRGGYHQGYNAHAEMRHRGMMHRDRGMMHRHHHDRIVVIKRHRH